VFRAGRRRSRKWAGVEKKSKSVVPGKAPPENRGGTLNPLIHRMDSEDTPPTAVRSSAHVGGPFLSLSRTGDWYAVVWFPGPTSPLSVRVGSLRPSQQNARWGGCAAAPPRSDQEESNTHPWLTWRTLEVKTDVWPSPVRVSSALPSILCC
jgi:hypothetical protein